MAQFLLRVICIDSNCYCVMVNDAGKLLLL